MTTYTYNIDSTFPEGLNTAVLQRDVSNAISKFTSLSLNEPNVSVSFSSPLTTEEEAKLDNAIQTHDVNSLVLDTFVVLTYSLPSGTNGGSFASGSWITRPINLLHGQNTRSWVSLSSNQITLAEGNYVMGANCIIGDVGVNQLRWHNVNSAESIYGTTSNDRSAIVQGSFVSPSGGSTYELQHRCTSGEAAGDTGFGTAANFGTPEIYTTMRITQVFPSQLR